MAGTHHPLDISPLEAVYHSLPLVSENGPDGKRIVVGKDTAAVAIDIFTEPSPVVRIRTRGTEELVVITKVCAIELADDKSVVIRSQQSECIVNNEGYIVFTRVPPPLPPKELTTGRSVLRVDKEGHEFQQSTLDIEGTPEGVRVHARGMVYAAPKQEGKGKDRALIFFLEEENQEKGEVVKHEVWATSTKVKEHLKSKQLKRGDIIEAVMYRYIVTVPTMSGEEITLTRHRLATITKVERSNAKRTVAASTEQTE